MSRVLVTGGGGYIGCVLTGELLARGYDVRVSDRFFFGMQMLESYESHSRLELFREDVRSIPRQRFEDVDAVVDLAGLSNDPACDLDPVLTDDININGGVRILELARSAGVKRYVYSSSCSVYGHGKTKSLNEDSPPNPVSAYAQSKVEVERKVLGALHPDFCVTVLRHATAYGVSPRMRFDLVLNLMTLHAFKRRRIFIMGGGEQWRPIVHVRDIAQAFIAVLEASVSKVNGEIFNAGSTGQNFQILQLAAMVKGVMPDISIEIAPDDPDRRTYHVSFDKIRHVLDFKTQYTPIAGILEIKEALERAQIEETPRTKTVGWYKYLIDAETILSEVRLDGRLF
jgi:nucleoside-diphosphate-sugar epimerase